MSIRSAVRTAIIAGVSLAFLVPVSVDASYAPESGRAERADRLNTTRAEPYIQNTNRFHVVCCVTYFSNFEADFCPDNFQLGQTARLGVSDARGDWLTVHWIKLRSDGNHFNKLTELLLLGDDGGVHGYTLGPRYRRDSDVYKRIRGFPNPTEVKYSGDHVVLDLRGDYAPGKNVPFACRVYGDSSKIFIHRLPPG